VQFVAATVLAQLAKDTGRSGLRNLPSQSC
jgi:hypothetical protein